MHLRRARRRAGADRGLSRDQVIAKRARASKRDFMEHGPRLWTGRQCYVVARSSDDERVLLGGVGGMGIGRMWSPASSGIRGDPTFAGAPVDDDAMDDFGDNGRGERVGIFRSMRDPVVFSGDLRYHPPAESYRSDPPAAWRGRHR